MPRILILGGAGFIGHHLARRLAHDGSHELTLVDDLSRGRGDAGHAAVLARPGVRFVQADLTDPAAFDALPRAWDQVYLLAAVVGVRNVSRDPVRVVRVNTRITLNALDWLATLTEPGVVFFASTSEAYAAGVDAGWLPVPTPEAVPVSLADVTNPRLSYAATKILGEVATLHWGAAHGFPVVVGRFHNVYGPRMGADHVIPELSLRALAGEDPFRVFGADQRRAFCHVDDAVDAMVRLMGARAAHGRVVNIGNDAEETVIADLARLVLDIAGVSPRLEMQPAPPGSVARRCPDLGLLRELTGFKATVALADGVRETFAWYREHHT